MRLKTASNVVQIQDNGMKANADKCYFVVSTEACRMNNIAKSNELQVKINKLMLEIALSPRFSVRFCDNSLLMLKTSFQVFPFASKKVHGFSSDRKMLKSL